MGYIAELLDSENSKSMAVRVRDLVLNDASLFDELIELFFSDDLRTCQRAAWPLGLLADKDASRLIPHLQRMVDNLDNPTHDAVIRNTFRTFQNYDFPEDIEGEVYEKAFQFFADVDQAVAIRIFAMTVCGNMALKYPELQGEIIPVIEESYPHGSAGFRARAQRVIKSFGTS